MKLFKLLFFVSISITIVIISCKKDTEETTTPETPTKPATTGTLILHFDNLVGDSALIFNTRSYTTANNDTFTVNTLKYYISNIKLINSDGSIYTESNSYHLVNAAVAASQNVAVPNVPFGKYIGVSFMIGVDSARNVSGAQTGALDPANGMFWTWSTGYMMALLQGTSPQSNATNNAITYNILGFSGVNSVLKIISPSLNNDTAYVSANITPKIYLKADLLEWFTTPNNVDIATLNVIALSGPEAKTIADNYADMFSYDRITN